MLWLLLDWEVRIETPVYSCSNLSIIVVGVVDDPFLEVSYLTFHRKIFFITVV